MPEKLDFHFHAQKGWINDPNGLCFFQGKYHAFFQHNPYASKWDTMHWGHAVSDDLIHWEEKPVALWPTEPYENDGGCFSGSAVIHEGTMCLFYTSVSHELGQTQSLVTSTDGVTFHKHPANPLIRQAPPEGSRDFRDPKVFRHENAWYMVCGSGRDGVGKILLFRSDDLIHWEYRSVLLEGAEFGGVLECPDLFPLGDKWVLMFSQMGRKTHAIAFCVGRLEGETFYRERVCFPEAGPQFYAPQTFQAPDGRRLLMAWMYDWDREQRADDPFMGALTVPRELRLTPEGGVAMFPVREASSLLRKEDPQVRITEEGLEIPDAGLPLSWKGRVRELDLLRDHEALEVFINHGEASFTVYQP